MDEPLSNFFENMDNLKMYENINSEEMVEEIYKEFLKRKELPKKELSSLNHIIAGFFFIESSKIFNDTSYSKDTPLAKIKEIITEGSEYNIHIFIYASEFSSLQDSDLSRYLKNFKKKIAFKGGNSLKMFANSNFKLEFSKAENVSIGYSGEIKDAPFKFKPYNKEHLLKIKSLNLCKEE
jgi:hypothetical protein